MARTLLVFALTGAALLAYVGGVLAGEGYRSDLSASDVARVAKVIVPATSFEKPEAFEAMSAGAATSVATPNTNAFSHPLPNLAFAERETFFLGNALFRKLWVSTPSSTQASDGLGPLFNARSCQRCHLKDGRGHPPSGPDDLATSMFLRLSVPARTEAERADIAKGARLLIPEPTYGGQLQDFAIPGLLGEGRMKIAYTGVEVVLGDGTVVALRQPTYSVADLKYGPLDPETMLSPRIAPPMIGLGLLEAIHQDDILAAADPDDANGDGISGAPSWVGPDRALGRFGWKASAPTVRAQSADAFAGDIGISTPDNPRHWGDCSAAQSACLAAQTGVQTRLGDTEAPAPVLDFVAFYSSNLAPPVRRDVGDPDILNGKMLFYGANCQACHRPKFVTRRDAAQIEHRFQLIWPYTDLLLHDMGDGLADERPVGSASGREWRTSPLWGIGLTETVSGHTYFLHDGRARSLQEAILWHDGEAKASRDAFAAYSAKQRADLIRFLESL